MCVIHQSANHDSANQETLRHLQNQVRPPPGPPAPRVNTPLPVVHGERVCTWAAPTRAALPAREIPPCMPAALAESVVAVLLE